MKYADVKLFDCLNGPGVRVSIFVSGCSHNCKGCFNKIAQDKNYGHEWTEEIENKILDYINKYKNIIRGISLLGGDPTYIDNVKPLTKFCKKFKKTFPEKDIWIWSGYTLDKIKEDENKLELIKQCDVLIDGLFIEELKDINLMYKGSSNQNVIDLKNIK